MKADDIVYTPLWISQVRDDIVYAKRTTSFTPRTTSFTPRTTSFTLTIRIPYSVLLVCITNMDKCLWIT
jgi:hypothetical protein